MVVHEVDAHQPRPFRRSGKGVFVVSVLELPAAACSIEQLYPLLIRTLSNLLIVQSSNGAVHLVTPEKGHVVLHGDDVTGEIRKRLDILASANLIIDNIFDTDLEPALWHGDAHTAAIARAGRRLAQLNLLPAPIRLEELLSPEDLAFLRRVYSIGGLSAGNFSERLDTQRFWMSASGIDKSRMTEVGRDFLLVKAFDEKAGAMRLSVPPNVEPRRVSVDAIEHWLVYRENPEVQAILHVHAWLNGTLSTEVHLPCGTYELGMAIAELVKKAPDPGHTVVGQKNHGLTITGSSLDEIMDRVGGKLVAEVPMS